MTSRYPCSFARENTCFSVSQRSETSSHTTVTQNALQELSRHEVSVFKKLALVFCSVVMGKLLLLLSISYCSCNIFHHSFNFFCYFSWLFLIKLTPYSSVELSWRQEDSVVPLYYFIKAHSTVHHVFNLQSLQNAFLTTLRTGRVMNHPTLHKLGTSLM